MTKERTVVQWISYDEGEKYEKSVGGLGGWFGYGLDGDGRMTDVRHTWDDYITRMDRSDLPY